MLKNMSICVLSVLCLPTFASISYSDSKSQAVGKIRITGMVVTVKGTPVPDVEVRCFYMGDKDFPYPWEFGRKTSDAKGQYEFHVPCGRDYFVEVGGKKATRAKSLTFPANSDKDVTVENLLVKPADGFLKGRILNSDGDPAPGVLYACKSESFYPYHPLIYPATDSEGSFSISNILPDENIDFWVVASSTKVQIWMDMRSGSDDLLLRLEPRKYHDLPPDWNKYFYIESLVRQIKNTKVRDRINFRIPDLEGNEVSLDSHRFKGKVIVVNIFGTWCGSCQVEIPHLVNFKKKYEDKGLEIIGIAFERVPESAAKEKIRELVEKHRVNYTVLLGGETSRERVLSTVKGIEAFSGYPKTIFIGKKGKVRAVKGNFLAVTPEMTKWQVKQFDDIITKLLKE